MRAWLLALAMTACAGPDRWHASTGLGDGEFETLKAGDRDFDSQWVEVGVSGPLFKARETPRPPPQPLPLDCPEPVESTIPWLELAILLSGAVAGKAGEVGYRKIRRKG